jgi:malic enzyme
MADDALGIAVVVDSGLIAALVIQKVSVLVDQPVVVLHAGSDEFLMVGVVRADFHVSSKVI